MLAPAVEQSGFALGQFGTPTFDGLTLEATSFGPSAELPRALVARGGGPLLGGFVTAGFATNAAGQHTFALVGYDRAGAIDRTFGSGGSGMIRHDIPDSVTEELFDLDLQLFRSQLLPVAVGTLADPDSIAVARFLRDGSLDPDFGGDTIPGVTRVSTGTVGASGAAIEVAPDGSIFVAGHASVNVADATGTRHGLHGSPVVARLRPNGRPDNRCTRSPGAGQGVFIWRPEGTANLITAQTLGQLVDTNSAPTYDMVVTDMALDPTGGIILVGYLHRGTGHGREAWVGRLNADCTPDRWFGGSTTGVHILAGADFGQFSDPPDNAWLSAVVVDPGTGRIYVGGTLTTFDEGRGFFAGRMFVVALRPDSSLDGRFSPGLFRIGGAVVTPDGWHEETLGMTLSEDDDERRVILAGMSYEDIVSRTRHIRMASFYDTGAEAAVVSPNPINAPGVIDAWATDVLSLADGHVVVSVAHRSIEAPPDFNPPPETIPPPEIIPLP